MKNSLDLKRLKVLSGIVNRTLNDVGQLDSAAHEVDKFVTQMDNFLSELASVFEDLNASDEVSLPDEYRAKIHIATKNIDAVLNQINQDYY